MLSLVICLGSIFWFILSNQKREQSYENIPINNNELSGEEEHETDDSPSLAKAIIDLKSNGCHIVNLKQKVYLDNPQYVSYEEFRLKAFVNQIVIAYPGDSGTLLLVQLENTQWIWIPS